MCCWCFPPTASLCSLRFLTTQPQLTAFARALCVCRVESWHRERRAGNPRGSAGDDDDDVFLRLCDGAISRSHTWSSCAARCEAVRACSWAPARDFWRDWHVLVEISSPVCGFVYSLKVASSAKCPKLVRTVWQKSARLSESRTRVYLRV